MSVFRANPPPSRVGSAVDVLDQSSSFLRCSSSYVHANVRFRSYLVAELQILIDADVIHGVCHPGAIQTRRAPVHRADSILPVIVGHEPATRPTDARGLQPPG